MSHRVWREKKKHDAQILRNCMPNVSLWIDFLGGGDSFPIAARKKILSVPNNPTNEKKKNFGQITIFQHATETLFLAKLQYFNMLQKLFRING